MPLYTLRFRDGMRGAQNTLVEARSPRWAEAAARWFCRQKPSRLYLGLSPAVSATEADLPAEEVETLEAADLAGRTPRAEAAEPVTKAKAKG